MFLNSLIAKKKVLTQEKKKGFTLVELLVVIAIIAILATVSTVGYLGFTKQAKISNDLTELTQYKTLITANTLDGYKYTTGEGDAKKEYTLTYTTTDGHALNLTAEEELNDDELLKQVIEDIIGEEKINDGNLLIKGDETHKSVISIAYYHHYDADKTNGSVIWNIAEDTVTKLA